MNNFTDDCIFCKIIARQIPSTVRYEDNDYIVFDDINPEADTHILIVPKKHIETVQTAQKSDEALLGGLFSIARHLAKEYSFTGYSLRVNVGADGGQIVPHVHMHLLAKQKM